MEAKKYLQISLLFFLVLIFENVSTSDNGMFTNTSMLHVLRAKRALQTNQFYQDTFMNFTELTFKYNYPSEEHKVITEDGYILGLYRILPKCETEERSYPVLLMHGILDCSDSWIVSGPKNGLAYILARNCYDVWVANHRGNSYSRRHVTLDPNKDMEFWNYSLDEHGNYDLPAIVDYVLDKTKRPKINFIGHSQGTTNFFVMNSLRPEYNEKFHLSIHLAPVAWMKHMFSPIIRLLGMIKQILDEVGLFEFLAKHKPIQFLLESLCHIFPAIVCEISLAVSTGYVPGTVSAKTMSIAFGHVTNGVSTKGLAHYGQLIVSGKFHRYDEGATMNMKRYGTHDPPRYNVSKVTVPAVLISGPHDWISSIKDVDTLGTKLPKVLENYVVPDPNWSHHSHLWGRKAPEYEFQKILTYLDKYNK